MLQIVAIKGKVESNIALKNDSISFPQKISVIPSSQQKNSNSHSKCNPSVAAIIQSHQYHVCETSLDRKMQWRDSGIFMLILLLTQLVHRYHSIETTNNIRMLLLREISGHNSNNPFGGSDSMSARC